LVLYSGARALLITTPSGIEKFELRLHAGWFLLLSVVFARLVIENHIERHPYHVGLWVLIVTYIAPYLYAWAIGLLCAYSLYLYALAVKGSLYRSAIRLFSRGVALTILGSIAIQFVNNTLMHQFSQSLGALLLANYVLVLIVAAGLLLMALGTKRLKRIEDATIQVTLPI
jgi:hypothetical protein